MASTMSVTATFLRLFKPQLQTRLAGNPSFNTVPVYLSSPKPEVALTDSVVLVRDEIVEEAEYAQASSRVRDNETVIPCALFGLGYDPDEDVAVQAAADRAEAILDEVIAEVRDNAPQVGLQKRSARVSRVAWLPQFMDAGGWVARVHFDITVKARVA